MTQQVPQIDNRYICDIVLMDNSGNVAVFDQFGQQMIEYQGPWKENRKEIWNAAYRARVWVEGLEELDREFG